MTRRWFLGALAALPFVGRFVRKPKTLGWHFASECPEPWKCCRPSALYFQTMHDEGWPVEWVSPEEIRRRYPEKR